MSKTRHGFERIGKEKAKELIRQQHEREAFEMKLFIQSRALRENQVTPEDFQAATGPEILQMCGTTTCVAGTVVLAAGGRAATIGMWLDGTSSSDLDSSYLIAPDGTRMIWHDAGKEVLGIPDSMADPLFYGNWGEISNEEDMEKTNEMMEKEGRTDITLVLRAIDYYCQNSPHNAQE